MDSVSYSHDTMAIFMKEITYAPLEMKRKKNFTILCGATIVLTSLFSCTIGIGDKERVRQGESLVFNELMSRNRTGLQNSTGKPADWIELKNTSKDSINLEGFQLSMIKKVSATSSKREKENPSEEDVSTWEFPDFTLAGGECVIIFADKGKSEGAEDGTLSADFKLPKQGATIQLLTPKGTLIKEVKYNHLSPDQSLALQADSTYAPTYWQSPGFENTREGYEKATTKITAQRHGPLLINEMMSRSMQSNDNWVELKNIGDKEVNLSEYALSKKLSSDEEYWQLPSRKLQPGELITIRLAGNDRNPNNPMQAPIKPGDSETLVLSKDGEFVDGICGKLTKIGGSIGRAEGKGGFFFYSAPTRNQENGKEGRPFIAEMPEFDHKPGIYAKDKELCVRLKNRDRVVRYTLDGRVPTSSSPIMPDSLLITKGTVIRTYAEGDSLNLSSNVATATYLPGAHHDIAVMNIAINKADLFDPVKGIYADGPGYGDEWPHVEANFWKDWTRDAHVEFFDGKEGFSKDCGLRIFGGFSRNEAKKSFRLKFRGGYGDAEVDYDFFDNGETPGLRDLVLRSGSQDFNRCMIRDEFFTSLMQAESPTLLTQLYRPVALYINGEYFGLYYLREKIDKHFAARKLGVSNDSINIIMSKGYNEEGPKTAYNNLINYAQSHDMTVPQNYAYMKENVDLQALIDYKLGQIYSGNTDVGNIRYVRSTSPGSDRKWHFVFYDLDATWVGYKPEAEYYLSMGGKAASSNVTAHNIVINRLLANKEFRALFLERLSHHLATTFSTKNATAVFDALVAKIRPEMKLNCERWPQLKYETWEKNIAEFRKKFDDKPKVMLNDLRNYLHITPEENKKYFSKLGY